MTDVAHASPRPVLCPVVVGRAHELSILEDALARARASEGGVAILVGEAGIGKTRLTREAERIALGASMTTLRGRAVRTSAPIPFRPLAEAIQSALRATGAPTDPELEPYHGVLRALVPEWGESSTPVEPSSFVVLEGITRLLRALARGDGMLLVLEDLHWADADTLAALEYLADNLASERILVLATIRSDEAGPAPAIAEGLRARRAAAVVHLSRLSGDDMAEMARAALGNASLPAPLLRIVGERAEGVPFLVEEMLSAYVASGGTLDPHDRWWGMSQRVALAMPASYRELIAARVAMLDDAARHVVTAAATLGPSFDWSLIPAITGLDRATVLAGLRASVDVQLVATSIGSGFRFRHALIPETVVAALLPPERAEICRRAAETVENTFPGLPGGWCERAADLREQAGDNALAATHLMEAAARAIKGSALASAEGFLERGRALVIDDVWHRFGFDRMLVDVLVQSGKMTRAEEIVDSLMHWFTSKSHLLRALAPAEMHIAMARAMADAGDWARARTFTQRARELGEQKEEVLARARQIEARWLLAGGDAGGAEITAAEALADAERLALPEIAFDAHEALGSVALARGDVQDARHHLERALSVADVAAKPIWRMRALLGLGGIDRWYGSIERLEEARDLAARVGSISSHARAEVLLAAAHVMRFDLERATAIVERCVDASRRYRLPTLPDALHVRAIVDALRDDQGAMEQTLADTHDGGEGARGMLAIVREDRVRAIEHLERSLVETNHARAFTPGLWVLLRTLEGDEGDEARARASALGWSALPDNEAAIRYADAIALGRAGEPTAARDAVEHADELLGGMPWNMHVGRRYVAEAAITDGWGEPVAWLRSSTAFFEDHGMDRVAAACRALLRRAGAPVRRKGRGDAAVPADLQARGVTSREMDVLLLVGERLPNKEIAERLFLSPRTVETHVSSLCRKLETSDRAGLVAWFQTAGGKGAR